jgi:RNA polymerase sigma-54 factor
MALSPRLEVKQGLGLTLTPQLMQSIKLLQLSHLELSAFIDVEMLRNPLLEREDGGEPGDDAGPVEPAASPDVSEDTVSFSEREQSAESIAESYDTEVENVFPEQSGADRGDALSSYERNTAQGGEDAPDLEAYVASRPSLAEHVETQAAYLLDDPRDRVIARFLADELTDSGYLGVDPAEIAAQLGTSLEAVERVLALLQTLDPPGLFARDVRECLMLQLQDRDRFDPMMAKLLDHLDLVAAHDFTALCRVVGCDREDLADMLAELRTLEPRPGNGFAVGPVEAVVPDVFVRPGPDGAWQVELNTEVLPRLLVNRSYYTSVTRQTRDPAEKAFMSECLATATWLIKSLDQRAQTLLKVSAEIVKQQGGFLEQGVAHLRPMTLRMVADAIELHESTVSRVTANKYMMTPRGVFDMKYFFTTALASSSGEADHSAESVRHRIRQLIDAEAPDAILSDDTLAEVLVRETGVEIARRTVAKYREGMNIPSSVIRRRQKREITPAHQGAGPV